MTKLSDLRERAEENFWPMRGAITPSEILALVVIAEAAHRMRQSTTMGAEREARDDLDAALKALEAT